jgi:hypothetical protein
MYAHDIADRFFDKFFENGYDCVICADYQDDNYDNLHGDLRYYINEQVEIEVFRNIDRDELEDKILFLDVAHLSSVTGIKESRLALNEGGSLWQHELDKVSRALRTVGLLPIQY